MKPKVLALDLILKTPDWSKIKSKTAERSETDVGAGGSKSKILPQRNASLSISTVSKRENSAFRIAVRVVRSECCLAYALCFPLCTFVVSYP